MPEKKKTAAKPKPKAAPAPAPAPKPVGSIAQRLLAMLPKRMRGGMADVDMGMLAKTENIITPKDIYNVAIDSKVMGYTSHLNDVSSGSKVIDNVGLASYNGGAKTKPKPKPKPKAGASSKPKRTKA